VIDTGMGFERLCMAVQGKTSNYDTDIFQPIIRKVSDLSGFNYGNDPKKDVAMRVVADHVRTIAFSITDGQLPSNTKAGYVIRRILRRAVRYGYTFLDLKDAFMYKLVPTLIDVMGDAYPELIAQQTLIEKVMKEEEDSFLRTLDTGIRLLDKKISELKAVGNNILEGEVAFQLYDTYGFPLDLTELILREHDMTVDTNGFDVEMQKQKERARNAAAVETGDWVKIHDGEPVFTGYDEVESRTQILRYRSVKQKNKNYYQIALSRSPFYAEMGGQVGDSGWLISPEGDKIEIFDTKRENNLAIHLAEKLPSDPYETFTAKIDEKKRTATECNHTATHLLHEALREVLGTHVEQRGSYVSSEVLRFDFSHFQKMTPEEIRRTEQLVTAKIRSDFHLEENRAVPVEEAKASGAMALFGEKYGDKVRTVRFGTSLELCGGTHISSTGRIGTFRIVSESAIAAGVRRIEAVTAENCENYLYRQEDLIKSIQQIYNNAPNLLASIKKSLDENSELKNRIEQFVHEKAQNIKRQILEEPKVVNGVTVYCLQGEYPSDMVREVAFAIRREPGDQKAFVAATNDNGKPQLLVMLSDDLVDKGFDASKMVREAASFIKGGGGGQKNFASAGGKAVEGLNAAFEAVLKHFQ
jgi:alanyl-tRNA synthetase